MAALSFSLFRVFCTGIGVFTLFVIGALEFNDPPITPPQVRSAQRTNKPQLKESSDSLKRIDTGAPVSNNVDTADTANIGVYQTMSDLRRLRQALRFEEIDRLRKTDPNWGKRSTRVRVCIFARYTHSSEDYDTVSTRCEQYYAELP